MNQTTITKQRGLSGFCAQIFCHGMHADPRPHSLFFSHLQGRSHCSFFRGSAGLPPRCSSSVSWRVFFTRTTGKNIFCVFTPSPFSWDWCSFPSIILHPVSSGRTAFSRRIRCLHPFPSCSSFFGASTGVRKNSGSGDFLPSLSGLSALSSVRAVRRIGSLWHSLRQFSLKPSGTVCPALPHCDHRRWHRHTARRRDSLPDAQTPQIAGRCLCTFRACVGHPARAAFIPA